MSTINLQAVRDDINPSDVLAKSCIDYINEVDSIIDSTLPAIKNALESNLASAGSDARFTADVKTEIQTAIDKITTFLG